MKHAWILLMPLSIGAAILPGIAQTQAHQETSTQAASKPAVKVAEPEKGELIFKQTCARCHDAPQGFSPRISGTVIRHMRVRASLSASDEVQIVKFLNP